MEVAGIRTTRAASARAPAGSRRCARPRASRRGIRPVSRYTRVAIVRVAVARLRNFTISPERYRQVAFISLVGLALIVTTGAAVRLTGSGLGCPDWPRCYGRVVAPLELHAVIEFANRMLSGFVGIAVIAASVLAFRRGRSAGTWRSSGRCFRSVSSARRFSVVKWSSTTWPRARDVPLHPLDDPA